jgi:hypothetical protein
MLVVIRVVLLVICNNSAHDCNKRPIGLVKVCLNETYSTVRIGKSLCNKFAIQNGLKEREALSPLLFSFNL